MSRSESSPLCRRGHEEGAHEHYRPGSDCGACGAEIYPAYRPSRPVRSQALRRLMRRLLDVVAGEPPWTPPPPAPE